MSLNGSEKGVFREGRIAGEFGAQAQGQGPQRTVPSPVEQATRWDSEIDLIDCCVVLGKCLAFSGPPSPQLHNENAERWFMPGYSRRM